MTNFGDRVSNTKRTATTPEDQAVKAVQALPEFQAYVKAGDALETRRDNYINPSHPAWDVDATSQSRAVEALLDKPMMPNQHWKQELKVKALLLLRT